MLRRIYCPLLLAFSLPLFAEEPPAAPTPEQPAAVAEPALPTRQPPTPDTFKSADDAYVYLQKLRSGPADRPKSREEFMVVRKEWLGQLRSAAEGFLKAYPTDPRHYVADLLGIQAVMNLDTDNSAADAKATAEALNKRLAALAAATDAPPEVQAEAAYLQVIAVRGAMDTAKPETVIAFFNAAAAFAAKHPDSPMAGELVQMELQVAAESDVPEAETLVATLAASKDEGMAQMAGQVQKKRAKIKELKAAPLELKFTDAHGVAVDASQLRGKVVMLDFWASWCGPCMAEMPNFVSTYRKLHDKGFEIIGVSLDEDKEAMEGALEKQGAPWPQSFDGGGWQCQIGKSFGIASIPSTWIFDKKGMLRATDKFGETLAPTIEMLLAE